MFGWEEIILILVLAVILLGPEKMTDVIRTLGRIYGEYQKAKRQLELEILYNVDDVAKKKVEDLTSDLVKDFKGLSKP